jgi:hypothetical protein
MHVQSWIVVGISIAAMLLVVRVLITFSKEILGELAKSYVDYCRGSWIACDLLLHI